MRTIALPVVLACCLAVTALVLVQRPSRVPGPTAAGLSGALAATAVTAGPRPAALFVGDSYTAGTGAGSPDDGYACQTAEAMGWVCLLDVEGATGYLNNGHVQTRHNSPFVDRLARDRREYRPDVVIVDGGRNDGPFPIADVVPAARTYLRRLHEAFPQARLVLIAPTYVSTTPANSPFSVQMADQLRTLGRPYGAVVLDPLGGDWYGHGPWRTLVAKDNVHPDQAAHTSFARHLTAKLKAADLGRLKAPARSL